LYQTAEKGEMSEKEEKLPEEEDSGGGFLTKNLQEGKEIKRKRGERLHSQNITTLIRKRKKGNEKSSSRRGGTVTINAKERSSEGKEKKMIRHPSRVEKRDLQKRAQRALLMASINSSKGKENYSL